MSLIKHLIISGGGPLIFQSIGIIQHLEKNKIFNRSNITSIYGTSSGAIVGLFLCLDYDWEVINKFMIQRPWENLYYIGTQQIYNGLNQCGLYNRDIFVKSYKSLFEAKDISIDVTMKEFYEVTNIDYHLISFEVNNLQMEDISHETYPDIKVIDAIHMTSCLPIFFTPVFIENKCFLDGGIALNYPLNLCINKYKNKEEMLGIKHIYTNDEESKNITKETGIIEYFLNIFYKLVNNISKQNYNIDEQNSIKHEIICYEKYMSLNLIITSLTNSEKRNELLENGIKIVNQYCEQLEEKYAKSKKEKLENTD
jgi:predicted patatin/cPLA2 family phospholipase